jgi:formylglycine-generating enzyme required for sulfatase activity
VDRYKWIEPRHLTHICDRFATNRTDMLQYALFNGDGYETWENIFGVWNQVTPRDGEALRRIGAIYRAVSHLLINPAYEPFTPTLQQGLFATMFAGASECLWTFVNRTNLDLDGDLIEVPFSSGTRFYDLWRGKELKPTVKGDKAMLAFEMEPRGFGAVLATKSALSKPVKQLLSMMRRRADIRLANLSAEWNVATQKMVEIPRTRPASRAPEGMVRIPSAQFNFKVNGPWKWHTRGLDVQYPWESEPSPNHEHTIGIQAFYIDKTPVTCAQFKRFRDAIRYRPRDGHNFLRNWSNGSFPEGWADKPVTWVSINDARAYAKWAGKRLPHEWEWQYAAQGTDGRLYPWGNEQDDSRMPSLEHTRIESPPADVDAHPEGASPFGVLDMVGNVWQWTDEFHDEHNRAAILRGGSHYRPAGSVYYFPQARRLDEHVEYWLLSDSTDRSATIGFRCVVDAE